VKYGKHGGPGRGGPGNRRPRKPGEPITGLLADAIAHNSEAHIDPSK
jgi:hypothetical protein